MKIKLVIDADGLNAISRNTKVLKRIKNDFVITPHSGEMARLIGEDTAYVKKNRLSVAKSFSNNYNAVVALKGYRTIVSSPKIQKAYINNTGNPGMATAGCGDVLTGIIGGFLAQGVRPFDAARLGVYVHGLAGDISAKQKGEAGLIAGDILDSIPGAIKIVTSN